MVCNQDTIGLSSPCSGGSSGRTMSNMWVRFLFTYLFHRIFSSTDFGWLLANNKMLQLKDLKGIEMISHKILAMYQALCLQISSLQQLCEEGNIGHAGACIYTLHISFSPHNLCEEGGIISILPVRNLRLGLEVTWISCSEWKFWNQI